MLPRGQPLLRTHKCTDESGQRQHRPRRIHHAEPHALNEGASLLDRPDGVAIQPPLLTTQLSKFLIGHKKTAVSFSYQLSATSNEHRHLSAPVFQAERRIWR